MEHTQAAIKAGEAGKAATLVEHATVALEHAKASEKAEANPNTGEGIVHLEAAIDVAKKDDAAGGTTHAKSALEHLGMATPKNSLSGLSLWCEQELSPLRTIFLKGLYLAHHSRLQCGNGHDGCAFGIVQ